MSFHKILVTVDSEPVAMRATETGVGLARALGADLALINVIDASLLMTGETGISPNDLVARAKQEARSVIDGVRQRLSLPVAAVTFIQSGDPAAEVAKAAKDWGADLIVIGSHGRAGLKRALLGSVAEGVMRQAPCPVLVVRARD